MEKAKSAHIRPFRAALRGADAVSRRTDVRGGNSGASLTGVLLRASQPGPGGGARLSVLDAASWVVLYTFTFRLIVSVHLSAMPGAQLADLAAGGGGLFAAVWSCHEFGGQSSKDPAAPVKKGVAGESCTFCTAVAGSAAAMPDETPAAPRPLLTSFSLTPVVSIRPAGSEYFHARPRGPPARFA
jgi:hypothetical protein